jgi:hypothetical protein
MSAPRRGMGGTFGDQSVTGSNRHVARSGLALEGWVSSRFLRNV